MRTITWARSSAAFFGILITAGFAFAAPDDSSKHISDFDEDDGTYSIQTVTSLEECEALCESDSDVCRGTVLYQHDMSKPEMQCRLNNGFGTNPVYPRPVPEALDFEKALSDFNAYRASNGLPALTYNEKLNKASEVHVRDLAATGLSSHRGSDGSAHGDRIQLQGYYFSIAGENIATGQLSWDAAFKAWKKSPGHNENMLRDDVSEFGLAFAYAPTTKHATYWAMLLAQPIDIEHSVSSE